MSGDTTYSKSFVTSGVVSVASPITPAAAAAAAAAAEIFPRGDKFRGSTVYMESYLGEATEPVCPAIPTPVIRLPDEKMASETTSKLSYRAPPATSRRPAMRPARGREAWTAGDCPMARETTTGSDFRWKDMCPGKGQPGVVLPRNNIEIVGGPLDARTTVSLSYQNPGRAALDDARGRSFKPIERYRPPSEKIDSETVNKLSFQPWTPKPKEELPRPRKSRKAPEPSPSAKDRPPMTSDTLYSLSYPPPGYYVEADCEIRGETGGDYCPCQSANDQDAETCAN